MVDVVHPDIGGEPAQDARQRTKMVEPGPAPAARLVPFRSPHEEFCFDECVPTSSGYKASNSLHWRRSVNFRETFLALFPHRGATFMLPSTTVGTKGF